jgi:hypothetical protein
MKNTVYLIIALVVIGAIAYFFYSKAQKDKSQTVVNSKGKDIVDTVGGIIGLFGKKPNPKPNERTNQSPPSKPFNPKDIEDTLNNAPKPIIFNLPDFSKGLNSNVKP